MPFVATFKAIIVYTQGWEEIDAHLNFAIGLHLNALGQHENSIQLFCNLLACGSVPAERQMRYVVDLCANSQHRIRVCISARARARVCVCACMCTCMYVCMFLKFACHCADIGACKSALPS